jgi:hypothetical protein
MTTMTTMNLYISDFKLGQTVRVDHVDHNGLCGRDPHPEECHVGCIGRIIRSEIDELRGDDAFELADTAARLESGDGYFTFLHTVLLETPGGDQVLVFADYELSAI